MKKSCQERERSIKLDEQALEGKYKILTDNNKLLASKQEVLKGNLINFEKIAQELEEEKVKFRQKYEEQQFEQYPD